MGSSWYTRVPGGTHQTSTYSSLTFKHFSTMTPKLAVGVDEVCQVSSQYVKACLMSVSISTRLLARCFLSVQRDGNH